MFTYSHMTNIYWKQPLVAIIYGANLNLWPLLLSDCAIIVRLCRVTEIIHEMEFILNEDHFSQQLRQPLYFLWHGNFMVGKSGKIKKDQHNVAFKVLLIQNKCITIPYNRYRNLFIQFKYRPMSHVIMLHTFSLDQLHKV